MENASRFQLSVVGARRNKVFAVEYDTPIERLSEFEVAQFCKIVGLSQLQRL